MQDYKTLRVPSGSYDRAQANKKASETWGDYIDRCTDRGPTVTELVAVDDVRETLVEAATDTDTDTDAGVSDELADIVHEAVRDAVRETLREELPEVRR